MPLTMDGDFMACGACVIVELFMRLLDAVRFHPAQFIFSGQRMTCSRKISNYQFSIKAGEGLTQSGATIVPLSLRKIFSRVVVELLRESKLLNEKPHSQTIQEWGLSDDSAKNYSAAENEARRRS